MDVCTPPILQIGCDVIQEGKDKGDAAAAAGMSCGELAALCTAGVHSWAARFRYLSDRYAHLI